LATDAEAVAGTSATLAVTIRTAQLAGMLNVYHPTINALAAANSGTGSNAGSSITAVSGRLLAPNALTAGYATRGFAIRYNSQTSNSSTSYDGVQAIGLQINGSDFGSGSNENTVSRVIFGRRNASIAIPTYTVAEKSFGFEIEYKTTGAELRVFGHDGTNLSTSVASFTPVSARTFQAIAVNEGGTVRLYVNGAEVASTTGGPTGVESGIPWGQIEIVNESTAATQVDIYFSNFKAVIPSN
jgi:hypothetical protein